MNFKPKFYNDHYKDGMAFIEENTEQLSIF